MSFDRQAERLNVSATVLESGKKQTFCSMGEGEGEGGLSEPSQTPLEMALRYKEVIILQIQLRCTGERI